MTAALLDGLARWLATRGHGVYRPSSTYTAGETAIVLYDSIPEPTRLVVLRPYPAGAEPDSRLPFDEPFVQVKVRGGADAADSSALAEALYADLHGLGPVRLPGPAGPENGPLLLLVVAQQQPAPLGRDEVGRYQHVFNIRAEVARPTAHRPAL